MAPQRADECLSLEWFRSQAAVKLLIESCRRRYNEVRPHSSLDSLAPDAVVTKVR